MKVTRETVHAMAAAQGIGTAATAAAKRFLGLTTMGQLAAAVTAVTKEHITQRVRRAELEAEVSRLTGELRTSERALRALGSDATEMAKRAEGLERANAELAREAVPGCRPAPFTLSGLAKLQAKTSEVAGHQHIAISLEPIAYTLAILHTSPEYIATLLPDVRRQADAMADEVYRQISDLLLAASRAANPSSPISERTTDE